MPDLVTGISVLQSTWVPGVYRLWIEETKASGSRGQGWIHIAENGTPNIPAKFPDCPDGCNSMWRFTRRGNFLDVTPSVNNLNSGFHNAGQWLTAFVEMNRPTRKEDDQHKLERYDRGSAVHYDLNWCEKDPARQQQLIAELKQQGVLK